MANVTIADVRAANLPDPLAGTDLLEAQQGANGTAFTLDEIAEYVTDGTLQTMTTRQFGLPGAFSPSDLGLEMQNMINFCATNGIKLIFMPDEFIIDEFVGDDDGGLLIPDNSVIHFEQGCVIRRADYVEEATPHRGRIISVKRCSNVTWTGVLELDGNGDSVTWQNEHSHNIFFFGCEDVDMRGLQIITYNAMGDCVSISGGTPAADVTERVQIGAIIAIQLNSLGVTARRSTVVIEGVHSCHIGYLIADNGDRPALHYEPFSSTDHVIDFHIGYCHLYSRFHAVVSATELDNYHRDTKIRIDTCIIEIPAGSLLNDYCLTTFACDISIDQLRIDYRYSNQANISAIELLRGGKLTVNHIQIRTSDTVVGRSVSSHAHGCIYMQVVDDRMPELRVSHLEIEGFGNKEINNRGGLFIADNIEFKGMTNDDGLGNITKTDNSVCGYYSQITFEYGGAKIGHIRVRNAKYSNLIHVVRFSSRTFNVEVGHVTVIDQESGNANTAISNGSYNNNNTQLATLTIGGVDYVGQAPTSFYNLSAGHGAFHAISGANRITQFVTEGSDPNGIAALAGSTCSCSGNGTFWVKTIDDSAGDFKAGWAQLATV